MRIHPLKHPQITEASSCTLLCRQLMIVQPLSQPRKPLLNIDSAICSLQLPPATFPPNPNTNQFCSKPVPQLRRPRKKKKGKAKERNQFIMQNQPQSSRQIVLQPLPKAIGINPAFCVNAQKTLLMKEKVFSLALDAFHVHDENNQEVCPSSISFHIPNAASSPPP